MEQYVSPIKKRYLAEYNLMTEEQKQLIDGYENLTKAQGDVVLHMKSQSSFLRRPYGRRRKAPNASRRFSWKITNL